MRANLKRIVALIAFVLLVCGLGLWQTQRRQASLDVATIKTLRLAKSGAPSQNVPANAASVSTASVSSPAVTSAGRSTLVPARRARLIQAGNLPVRAVDPEKDFVWVKGHKAHPTRMLAKFSQSATNAEKAAALQQFKLGVALQYAETSGLVLLDLANGPQPGINRPVDAIAAGEKLSEQIQALQQTGVFAYVEPDYIVSINATPTDAAFTDGSLWGLRNTGQSGGVAGADIGAVPAWDITTGSTNVVVAIIDTGIRYTHQDLAAQMWRNQNEISANGIDDDGNGYVDDVFGINAINDSGNPFDDNNHGTHVSGTIGAAAHDANRHVGVAWQVGLMGCKFLDASGNGFTSDAIQCIQYAAANQAKILNNSWGGDAFSQGLLDAIVAARNQGILFVAAAGNSGVNTDQTPFYPSGYAVDNVLSVAALDRRDLLASFSNFGSQSVDLGAPGVSIYSATAGSDTAYASFNGTSMAAPHVSGVAALVAAQFPGVTLTELRQRLLTTTVPVAQLSGKSVTGGRVNAYNALTATGDGRMEVSLAASTVTPFLSGSTVSIFVALTDLGPVTNATVTGTTGTNALTFQNNGAASDQTANDHVYTASFIVPSNVTTVTLTVYASAPGKTNTTNTVICGVVAPEPNDKFINRINIASDIAGTSVTGANVAASKEPGEPNHAGFAGGKSVWWTWRSPINGNVTITTAGSSFDTLLAVYTGSLVSSLSPIASNDDSGGGSQSAVTFSAVNNTFYQIAVDGWNAASGNIILNVTPAPDTNRPTVAIAYPKSSQRITNNLSITMSGTARDTNSGLAQVFYKLNGGPFQLATGTTNWTAALALVPGTNRVDLKSVDIAGNESLVVGRIFYTVIFSPFTLMTSGPGSTISTPSSIGTPTNGASLEVGRSYTVNAIPAANNLFSNWTGTTPYTNALFTFIMQANMNLTANFVPNPFLAMQGVYNGLFYEMAGVSHHSAGFFTMTVATNLTFTGKLLLDGDSIALSGKFNLDGTLTKSVPRAGIGKSDLTLALALDFANGTDQVTGTVSDGANWISELRADRNVWSTNNPATIYTNSYTMLTPGFSDANAGPAGYGYATIIIDTNGLVKSTSLMADAQAASQSVALSKNGEWPVYAQMYRSIRVYTNLLLTTNMAQPVRATNSSYYAGSLLGWLTFANHAPTGTLSWIKTGWTNNIYPHGFTNETSVLGSSYVPPATGQRALDLTNGTVTLTDGNLSSTLTRNFTLSTNNILTVTPTNNFVRLTLTKTSGLLTGSFRPPENPNTVFTIRGVILQDQNFGGGHFLGTNQSGKVLLQGN